MLCPCGSKLEYKQCCEPVIVHCNAKSPEQLMRSRYSAYALQCYYYVFNTYCNSSKKTLTINDIVSSANKTKWLNLRVINSSEFKFKQKPTVEFEVIYINDNIFYKMFEKSSFIEEDQSWKYVDAIKLSINEISIPNRNDKCICLSDKKYKKCCGINL